ncbi:MAG TPA: protein kinase [Pirellulales bacterium]|nr:protein kinase [Pirellulales bacterium]
MPTAFSEIDRRRPLAEVLSNRPCWPCGESLRFIRALAEQVSALHRGGHVHRAIDAGTVFVTAEGQPVLEPPPAARGFGGHVSDPDRCPPELAGGQWLELPPALPAVAQLLGSRGAEIDPRRIDVYQIGVLFYRLLTGKPLQSYLYSPSAKAGMPGPVRTLLDRSLGYDDVDRFNDCEALIAAIDGCLGRYPQSDERDRTTGDTRSRVADRTNEGSAQARDVSVAADAPLPLTRLGSCRIVARLGQGGMGDVYKAHDESLDRWVAIKVLPPQLARDADFVARFRAEASAVARLTHPNVVQVYSIGEEQGHHYFVMQFVEGESLAERLHRVGRLDVAPALAIVEQCLSGLAAAHEAGLVHRDVKPGNVLLDGTSGRALVADFGLAKRNDGRSGATATGVILGTVDYLSPEQACSLPVDARSDLYSMGVLLYEALSGKLPFQADSATAMIFQHAYEPPRPLVEVLPDVPPDLARIVERLLRKPATERYQTARELIADLESVRQRHTDGGQPSALRRATSQVLKAPEFGPEVELPAVPNELPSPWQRWQDRALSVARRHTPELVRELQSTSQQVDAAVAEYQRRRQKLAYLREEARAVAVDLAEQLREQRAAAEEADARLSSAADPIECAAATSQKAETDAQIELLARSYEEQQHELNEIELKLAKADATLARLQSQRDLLQARLKAAGAEKQVAGVRAKSHRGRRWAAVGAASLVLALLAAVWLKSSRDRQSLQQDASASIVPPVVNGFNGTYGRFSSPVEAVAFPPQKGTDRWQFFVGQADGSVRGFELTGKRDVKDLGSFGDRTKTVTAIVCSPDGSRVAVASEDSTIGIFDLAAGRETRSLSLTANPRRALAFSADSSQLMTDGTDGVLRTWDIRTETEQTGVPTSEPSMDTECLAWSRDGTLAALGYRLHGGNSLLLWDVAAARPLRVFRPSPGPIDYVAFVHNDDRLLSLAGTELVVWDCETGEKIDTLGTASAVAVMPDGWRAVVGGVDGRITLVDLQTKEVLKTISPAGAAPKVLAVSADGLRAVSAADKTALIWELPPPPPAGQLREFDAETPVYTVSFSPDGFHVLSGDDHYLRVRDVDRASKLTDYQIGRRVTNAEFSSDVTRILYSTGMANSRQNFVGLRLYSADSAAMFLHSKRDERHFAGDGSPVVGAAFLPGGRRIVTVSPEGAVRVFDLLSEDELLEIPTHVPVNAFAVSSDGERLLLAAEDNSVRLWSLVEQRELHMLIGHTFQVTCAAMAANAPRGATGSGDRTVRVWNVLTGDCLAVLEGHTGRVNAVALSSDGRHVLSASDDETLRYWSVEPPRELKRFEGHVGPVRGAAISPNGKLAASGGDDHKVRIWSLETEAKTSAP